MPVAELDQPLSPVDIFVGALGLAAAVGRGSATAARCLIALQRLQAIA
jgi:hypothetical protein